jgi:hypothetical protein
MSRPPLDWTKTGTVNAMADWIRKDGGAFVVLVIRRDDAVLVVDAEITPRDAQQLVEDRIGDLAIALDQARRGMRKDARLEFGTILE